MGILKKFNFTKKKNKLDTVFKKTTSTDEKFDLILSEIKAIKTDLSDFRGEFNKYKKQDSDFQEMQVNNFVLSLLDRNKNAYTSQLIPIKEVYVPNSANPLTEMDGLILYTPTPPEMPRLSSELTNRVDQSFQESLKPNIMQINSLFTDSQLIVVESKRSVSKQKIDTKISQVFEFMNVLKRAPSLSIKETSEEFQTCMKDLEMYSNLTLDNLSQMSMKLIFGSDDISPNVYKYICAIDKGITESQYNQLCGIMFKEDVHAGQFIQNILKSPSIPKKIKELLKHYATFEELRNVLQTHFKEYDMGVVKPYLTPFRDLEHLFLTMKGCIGVVQFNRATFPELFQFTTLY